MFPPYCIWLMGIQCPLYSLALPVLWPHSPYPEFPASLTRWWRSHWTPGWRLGGTVHWCWRPEIRRLWPVCLASFPVCRVRTLSYRPHRTYSIYRRENNRFWGNFKDLAYQWLGNALVHLRRSRSPYRSEVVSGPHNHHPISQWDVKLPILTPPKNPSQFSLSIYTVTILVATYINYTDNSCFWDFMRFGRFIASMWRSHDHGATSSYQLEISWCYMKMNIICRYWKE